MWSSHWTLSGISSSSLNHGATGEALLAFVFALEPSLWLAGEGGVGRTPCPLSGQVALLRLTLACPSALSALALTALPFPVTSGGAE